MTDEQRRNSVVVVVFLCCLLQLSNSYEFVVGGSDGWVVKPSENYNQWAERMRFQVNDTILFKYKSGSDSVMVVNKEDYDKCNTANPLLKLDDGNSIVKFDRSGPFYFISGNKASCDQGQKLIVVVMAVRSPPSPPSPPQGSSPSASPPVGAAAPGPASSVPLSPSPSTSGGAPAPATLPSSPSPSSASPSPVGVGAGPSPAADVPSSGGAAPAGDVPTSGGGAAPGAPGSSTPGSGTANSPPAPQPSMAALPCSSSVMFVLSACVGLFVVSA